MANCLALTGGIEKNCKPLAAGTKDRLILIPYDDILAIVTDATRPKVVTGITLKSGKKGFLFEGYNNSTAIREGIVPGKYNLAYKHELDLVAFGVQPADMAVLEAVNAGRYVAITETNNKLFKVLGANAGLRATKNDNDTANKDTGGANEATLASEDEAGYAEFFQKLVGTPGVYDYAATRTAFDALLVAAI